MSSFIDLMGNDAWSDADIVNRTEAIIAGQFPRVEVLKRKVTGMILGQYQLTGSEQQEFAAYATASFSAGQLADTARADMALLLDAKRVEAATHRLADPVKENDTADSAERARAQAVIDAATAPARALVLLRNPPPAGAAP